jgi:hypothetical protein
LAGESHRRRIFGYTGVGMSRQPTESLDASCHRQDVPRQVGPTEAGSLPKLS